MTKSLKSDPKQSEDYNAWQRFYRNRVKNAPCKKYEKTISGFLMRAYRNMKSRITGVQKEKAHLYAGLSLLPKDQFYSWAKADPVFNALFTVWVDLGYPRALSPSIDRIDPEKGYELSNMRWLTHGENSKLGAISRWKNQ